MWSVTKSAVHRLSKNHGSVHQKSHSSTSGPTSNIAATAGKGSFFGGGSMAQYWYDEINSEEVRVQSTPGEVRKAGCLRGISQACRRQDRMSDARDDDVVPIFNLADGFRGLLY